MRLFVFFCKKGHTVHLYTYQLPVDVPEGVQACDANEIIPANQIIRHKASGSYALFSDIFRYQLLKQTTGIYVDCDVYCLRPLHLPEHGYLFGYEDDRKINGAVLALPKNSALLDKLLEIARDPKFIPPWYGAKKIRRLQWKKRFGLAKHIADMLWGVIGPDAISYFARQFGVDKLAQDIDIFYPVHYYCMGHLLNPAVTVEDISSSRTQCIHLYNEMLRGRVALDCLDKNSVLSKMLAGEI